MPLCTLLRLAAAATGIAGCGGSGAPPHVATTSRARAYDPPPAGAPVPGFSAEGFTCAGTHDTASMLALDSSRCTRGSAVVTFQRS